MNLLTRILVLAVLLVALACIANSSHVKPGSVEKSEKQKEKDSKKVEINNRKKDQPVYKIYPREALKSIKDMGVKLKSEDKDLIRSYLSNASVLLLKLQDSPTKELNGSVVLNAIATLGKTLLATLPSPNRNDSRGKKSEHYEGLDMTMEIVKQKRDNFTGYEFPPVNATGDYTDVSGRESKIRLPQRIFKNSVAVEISIISFVFNAIPEMEERANKSLRALTEKWKARINAKIISTSIDPPLTQDLDAADDPVVITFSRVTEGANSVDSCVFWDPKANDNAGDFSTRGCKLTFSNASHVICECRHLTEFTVLSSTQDPSNGAGTFGSNHLNIFISLAAAIFFLSLGR